VSTVTALPAVLLETPESLALTSGKVARLKVRVKRFDGGKSTLKIEPDPSLPDVKFENNVIEPGSSQVELRVTAANPVTAKSFRLRAGDAVSPAITVKMEIPEESSR
jgi:hypothetical protein